MMLQQIAWADEIRDPGEFAILDKPVELDPKAEKMAHALVESMLGEFNHVEHTDTYVERVRELVNAKAAGTTVTVREEKAATEDVSDLLAKLEESVRRHPAGKGTAKAKTKTPARKRSPAA
ncbi:MAG: hypothetical protein ACLP5J_25255 [Mycobacterium sp.]|uniref:hypothetical protein n=1 Tax=Mycobacterium sp. TaxID=1785 RepID=UPI003F99E137